MLSSTCNRPACVWSICVKVEGVITPEKPCFESGDTEPIVRFRFLDFPQGTWYHPCWCASINEPDIDWTVVDIKVQLASNVQTETHANSWKGKTCKFELSNGITIPFTSLILDTLILLGIPWLQKNMESSRMEFALVGAYGEVAHGSVGLQKLASQVCMRIHVNKHNRWPLWSYQKLKEMALNLKALEKSHTVSPPKSYFSAKRYRIVHSQVLSTID